MTQRDKRILRQTQRQRKTQEVIQRGKERYQKKKERDSDTDVNAVMYKETERKDKISIPLNEANPVHT